MYQKISRLFALSFFALSLGFTTGNLRAEGLYIAPEVGYLLPTESEIDDGLFLGARIGSEISPNVAVEVESGFTELNVDFTSRIQDVDLQHIPLLFNMQYAFNSWEEGGLFALAGVGWGFNDLENPISGDNEAEDSVSWQLGLGYEAELGENSSLVFDVRYYRNDPDVDFDDDLTLSAVMFNLGIKFGG